MSTEVDRLLGLIASANFLIQTLDSLIVYGRPELLQRVAYVATRFFLQVLVNELEQLLAWYQARDGIRTIIGNDVFDGLDNNNDPYPLETMTNVRDALDSAQCGSSQNELACLVAVAGNHPEIDDAVKQRIIYEVNLITPYEYTAYDQNEQPLALEIPDPNNPGSTISVAFTDDMVTASIFYGNIPFEYVRQAVADLARDLSKRNFRLYSAGGFPQLATDVTNVVGKIVQNNAARDYSASLTHQSGTGSAIFVSECIYAGRMPMTVRPLVNDPSAPECSETDLDGYRSNGFQDNSWRYCPNQQTSSLAWKAHPALYDYFAANGVGLSGEILAPIIGVQTVDDNTNPSNKFKLDYLINSTTGELSEGQFGYDEAYDKLVQIFNTSPFSHLAAGDYVYISGAPPNDNHGLMIVGWGPILGVQDSIDYVSPLDSQEVPGSLSIRRGELDSTHIVPYVADFCFGSDGTDDGTGWLQDPRPRAFYATVEYIEASYLRSDQQDLLRKIAGSPVYQPFTRLSGWQFHRIVKSSASDPLQDITIYIPFERLFRQFQDIQS